MSPWEKIKVPSIQTMDLKSWRLYVIPPSVCFAVLVSPPLLLVYATTVFILKPLWRSCLLLFFRTHKPCAYGYMNLLSANAQTTDHRCSTEDGSLHTFQKNRDIHDASLKWKFPLRIVVPLRSA